MSIQHLFVLFLLSFALGLQAQSPVSSSASTKKSSSAAKSAKTPAALKKMDAKGFERAGAELQEIAKAHCDCYQTVYQKYQRIAKDLSPILRESNKVSLEKALGKATSKEQYSSSERKAATTAQSDEKQLGAFMDELNGCLKQSFSEVNKLSARLMETKIVFFYLSSIKGKDAKDFALLYLLRLIEFELAQRQGSYTAVMQHYLQSDIWTSIENEKLLD